MRSFPPADASAAAPEAAAALKGRLLECVETGADGKLRFAVTLPGAEALDALAGALSRLMAGAADREAKSGSPS